MCEKPHEDENYPGKESLIGIDILTISSHWSLCASQNQPILCFSDWFWPLVSNLAKLSFMWIILEFSIEPQLWKFQEYEIFSSPRYFIFSPELQLWYQGKLLFRGWGTPSTYYKDFFTNQLNTLSTDCFIVTLFTSSLSASESCSLYWNQKLWMRSHTSKWGIFSRDLMYLLVQRMAPVLMTISNVMRHLADGSFF